MKKIIIIVHFFVFSTNCQSYAQTDFNRLIEMFPVIQLPVSEIEEFQSSDTLDIELLNKMFVTTQSRPFYIQNGKRVEENKYYGKVMRERANYIDAENNERISFSTKVYPVGRIVFRENYISLIVKVVALETTFYDVYNLTKDGKLMSYLPLSFGYRSAPHKKEVSYVIIDTEITKDGLLKWHENIDGLETFRIYKLNEDGYFEIIEEEQKGESEF